MEDLIILPMKTFGAAEVDRLAGILKNANANHRLTSISASGHAVPPESLRRLGEALATATTTAATTTTISGGCIKQLAIGDQKMGDAGVVALCEPLEVANGGTIEVLDLAWKGM